MQDSKRTPRRECLRLGLLGGLGLTLPELFSLRAAAQVPRRHRPGRAKSCILLFMYGGPAHKEQAEIITKGISKPRAVVAMTFLE